MLLRLRHDRPATTPRARLPRRGPVPRNRHGWNLLRPAHTKAKGSLRRPPASGPILGQVVNLLFRVVFSKMPCSSVIIRFTFSSKLKFGLCFKFKHFYSTP